MKKVIVGLLLVSIFVLYTVQPASAVGGLYFSIPFIRTGQTVLRGSPCVGGHKVCPVWHPVNVLFYVD